MDIQILAVNGYLESDVRWMSCTIWEFVYIYIHIYIIIYIHLQCMYVYIIIKSSCMNVIPMNVISFERYVGKHVARMNNVVKLCSNMR